MIARRPRIGWAAQPKTHDRDVVQRGQEAWTRHKSGGAWSDWLAIGEALLIGRRDAMAAAKTNKPSGRRYNTEFGNWLTANRFDDIDKADRCRLFAVMEKLTAIETWRATLSPTERLKINSPCTVWRKFQAATNKAVPKPKPPRDSVATLKKELEAATERAVEAEAARDLDARPDGLGALVAKLLRARDRYGSAASALADLSEIEPTQFAALAKWFAELAGATEPSNKAA